jgi:hypothetical protein
VCTFNDFRIYKDGTFHVLVTLSAIRTCCWGLVGAVGGCLAIRLAFTESYIKNKKVIVRSSPQFLVCM